MGCTGILSNSRSQPGAPDAIGFAPSNCASAYHRSQKFEAFASGHHHPGAATFDEFGENVHHQLA